MPRYKLEMVSGREHTIDCPSLEMWFKANGRNQRGIDRENLFFQDEASGLWVAMAYVETIKEIKE